MFRDSQGVVHTVCSADPLLDLPPGAAAALQAALLTPPEGGTVDIGSVLERCDAVRELVERWQDAFFAALPEEVDLEEESRWAAEAGLSLEEVEAGYHDDEDDDDDRHPFVLPGDDDDEDDVALDLTIDDAEDPRAVLPDDLVSNWSDLVADHEKLLGHLVLAHAEPPASTGHEALIGRHAVLHTTSGPGHPEH